MENSGVIATVLMDLSKAYDCIPHDLLIAKLHAYGIRMQSLKLLYSYLTNRKQRVKINNSFSDWFEIKVSVPQSSVLGPLLFNIFINDLLLCIEDDDLCNFADDNTLYKCCRSVIEAKLSIEMQCSSIILWFKANSMKMNPEKCHIIILGDTNIPEDFTIQIDNVHRAPESEVTLLGITLDSKFDFNSHITKIYKEASKRLNAFLRISKYLTKAQKSTLISSFFYSHFNYCPLVWMFSSKESNIKIEKLHKRALQIIHDDFSSPYETLLLYDNSTTIQKRNLQFLMPAEIFKTINNNNPPFMKEIFAREDSVYNLRCMFRLKVPRVLTTKNGLETISFRGSQIWNLLLKDVKEFNSVATLKRAIKDGMVKTVIAIFALSNNP